MNDRVTLYEAAVRLGYLEGSVEQAISYLKEVPKARTREVKEELTRRADECLRKGLAFRVDSKEVVSGAKERDC